MPPQAWLVAGLVVWMAAWWMTEALPLTATALLPFLVLPMAGVMDAKATAAAYYSPILFLILGGAFLALAIERTGLHRRLALGILKRLGDNGGADAAAARLHDRHAILSMVDLQHLDRADHDADGAGRAGRRRARRARARTGFAGALPMGIAFAA